MKSKIRIIILDVLGIKQNCENDIQIAVYRTPGWDSLATIEIVEKIEEVFSVEISDLEMVRCDSLEALHGLLLEKMSDKRNIRN
ncbi:MAG: acyl carrier protein [Magnetococcales bacterium]|nr:acyl carrier protein [Magnetococcales bacterium]